MPGVRVTPLKELINDERGDVFGFATRPATDFLLIRRKKATISGEHYHEGKVSEKNPETLILLEGEIELYTKDLKTGEETRQMVSEPSMIEMFPNVWHEVKALTDIIFIELNSLEQHKKDTIKHL